MRDISQSMTRDADLVYTKIKYQQSNMKMAVTQSIIDRRQIIPTVLRKSRHYQGTEF